MNIKTVSWIVIGVSAAIVAVVLLFRPASGPLGGPETAPSSSARVETSGRPVLVEFYTES